MTILLSSCHLMKISKIVVQHLYETFIFMEANDSEISLCKQLLGKFSFSYQKCFQSSTHTSIIKNVQTDSSTHTATDSNS